MTVASEWIRCSTSEPCSVCGKPDWCQVSADRTVAICMRIQNGAWQSKVTDSGSVAHFHRLAPAIMSPKADSSGEPDVRHEVYLELLKSLQLSEKHRADLLRRKGSPESCPWYRTLPLVGRAKIAKRLLKKFDRSALLGVPGIIEKQGEDCPYITIAGSPGLLIPIWSEQRKIIAIKIRPDDQTRGKYRWMTSSNPQGGRKGPSPGTPAHCPTLVPVPSARVRLTEGPLKADIASGLNCLPAVAADSVANAKPVIALLQRIGCKIAVLSFDADWRTNPQVAAGTARCAEALREAGIEVEFEVWPAEQGKGIDDVLAAGLTPEIIAGPDVDRHIEVLRLVAAPATAKDSSSGLTEDDDRPEIEITPNEHQVNGAAIEALAKDEAVFQRAGLLVGIVSDATEPKSAIGLRRPEGAARITTLPHSVVREKLTKNARFVKVVETADGEIRNHSHPPAWCVNAVAERGSWRGIRHLTGVVNAPALRPDGSILSQPGYDAETGLYLAAQPDEFPIPAHPTIDDARSAAAMLLGLAADFPFLNESHKSGWLAALITPICRHAFEGQAPLFFIDAAVPGTGKTLAVEAIAQIVTGRTFPVMGVPSDDAEMAKQITSIAASGDELVLLDNIPHGATLNLSSLDRALTSSVWRSRMLGGNEVRSFPMNTTWFGTGNNVSFSQDLSRRVCSVRLESKMECPEQRSDFRYPDLIGHISRHRPELFAAAITIPAAFILAGRPAQGLKAWGSFQPWSNLVRQCLTWCGLPDPIESKTDLLKSSDTATEAILQIFQDWPKIDPDGTGLTAAEILKKLDEQIFSTENFSGYKFSELRDAVMDFCGAANRKMPTPRVLGNRLRAIRGRVIGGRSIKGSQDRTNIIRWFIVSSAGSAWSEGSVSNPEKISEIYMHNENGHMHISAEKCGELGSDPANPADPASASDWLSTIPVIIAQSPSDLKHRSPSCGSVRGWESIWGETHCLTCSPPTELSVVVQPAAWRVPLTPSATD